MRAVLVDENKNLVLSEVPDPVIKDDEVLVKIYAAALNRADLLQRQGTYPSPPGCPEWMGLEIEGIIEKIGEKVTDWKVGDRVCALRGGGGFQGQNEGSILRLCGNLWTFGRTDGYILCRSELWLLSCDLPG